ncbi:hypothetical protein GCM10010358_35210 [Streptomyces minutiscleroticus]|uniref:Uncharacterized protein n=1 Tax=Streptomyces minutiscleroticus TaxID=68238 RepID=A0A918NL19_9ACTN|nr:hypothetical protein GCM10010358_35210 [Streptomyces minutiscleroticus]
MRPAQYPHPLDGVGARFQGHPRIGQLGLPVRDAAADIVTQRARVDKRRDRGPRGPVTAGAGRTAPGPAVGLARARRGTGPGTPSDTLGVLSDTLGVLSDGLGVLSDRGPGPPWETGPGHAVRRF